MLNEWGNTDSRLWQQIIRQEPSSPKGWLPEFPVTAAGTSSRNKQMALGGLAIPPPVIAVRKITDWGALVLKVSSLLMPKWVGINEFEMS